MQTKIVEISGLLTALWFIKGWWDRLVKVALPIVKEAERRGLEDGLIDGVDRKALAMMLVNKLEIEGNLKLNFISRIVISKVIDIIAKSLPDFQVSRSLKNEQIKTANQGKTG